MKRHCYSVISVACCPITLLVASCSSSDVPPQLDGAVADSDDRPPVQQEKRPESLRRDPSVSPQAKHIPEHRTVQPQTARTGTPASATPAKPAAAPITTTAAASSSPAPEPPREVRVPSGTLVAIRMIDSVDSGTAHLGETFKASLDQPISVDNETLFPRGSEVYVKVVRVQSAGRVRGQSELELQLDRIFLGRQSYAVASNPYTSTGASQTTRTAKTAGLGAMIGGAIGAISGGGKGAIIGASTGAGARVGAEAIRKGDQVRVESESRIDFRLESSIQVTVPSSSNNQPRNNPSVPPRFGTRLQ